MIMILSVTFGIERTRRVIVHESARYRPMRQKWFTFTRRWGKGEVEERADEGEKLRERVKGV